MPFTSLRAGRTSLQMVIKPHTVAPTLPWNRALRNAPYLRFCTVLASASLLLGMTFASALAQQQTAGSGISGRSLPDAPVPKSGPLGSAQPLLSAEESASVAGIVLDASGATVPGAEVGLTYGDGTQWRTMESAKSGKFEFMNILPGSYRLIVKAEGFAPFTSAKFVVTEQQAYEIPDILLSVATASIEVTVRPTDLIAAEQIKSEEKQRLIGVIPNFYTSYIYDAAPLTWKQKFSLAARGTFDPVSMIGVGFAAGLEQANNSYPAYGQGAAGYSKRFAAKFVDGRTSDFLTHAVFPSLFHQDPRYYYQGSGSFKSRFIHAVGSAFVTRSDRGLTVPNYSFLLGDICSAALSNLYYPPANRGVNLVFNRAAVGLAGRVGGNLIREFLSKRLTTNVPDDGRQ
jgi:Carboxypeptidase regulatory-like domain